VRYGTSGEIELRGGDDEARLLGDGTSKRCPPRHVDGDRGRERRERRGQDSPAGGDRREPGGRPGRGHGEGGESLCGAGAPVPGGRRSGHGTGIGLTGWTTGLSTSRTRASLV